MKFHDSDPSIIYRYGLRWPPREVCVTLRGEMRAANKYYNAIVEIMRRRTEKYLAKRRELYPDFERLEIEAAELGEQIDHVRTAIKAQNAQDKRRSTTPEQRDQIAALKLQRAGVWEWLKAMRAEIKESPDLAAAAKVLDAAANAEAKQARKDRLCAWGTGGVIERSVQQAAAKSHGMPEFRRWDGGGIVAVQIQNGLSIDDAFFGRDTRLRIDEFEGRERSDLLPRSKRMTNLHVRVGSDGREPIWATVPLIYHRPLPDGSRIKWVYITMKLVGKREVWEACLFVSHGDGFVKADCATDGEVGIDVGWRLVDGGLRVAYAVGSDGEEEELILPDEWVRGWTGLREMQSARELDFDVVRGVLAEWLDDAKNLPDWLAEATATLRQWRSANRLWYLVARWRENRIDGDAEIFPMLLDWWRRERRDHNGSEGMRRRLINERDEMFRRFAVRLRRRYRTAQVESLNLRQMARSPLPEEEAPDGAVKHYSKIAAVGRLLSLVREHMAETVAVPAKDTTRRCYACGYISDFDRADIYRTCPACGDRHDQDRCAAMNLLLASGPVPEVVL